MPIIKTKRMELVGALEHSLFDEKDFTKAIGLIEQGADVDGYLKILDSQLIYSGCFLGRAILNQDFEVFHFLLKHGADVSVCNGYAFTVAIGPRYNATVLSLLLASLNNQTQAQFYFYTVISRIESKEELEMFLRNGLMIDEVFANGLNKTLYPAAAELIYELKPKITSSETVFALFHNQGLIQQGEELITVNRLPVLVELPVIPYLEGKATIAHAIKSVAHYDRTLDSMDIEAAINNLGSSKLFEPILAYYALSALLNKHPITFYNILSSHAGDMDESLGGKAYYDGTIGMKKFPISHEIAQDLTEKIFNLIDGKTEFALGFFDKALTIFLSEDRLDLSLKNKESFIKFLAVGLYKKDSSILFHEITHRVMDEVFKYKWMGVEDPYSTYAPYFNSDTESRDDSRAAICSVLFNIEEKFLSAPKVTNAGSCQDLWSFGTGLANKLLGNEVPDTEPINIPEFERIIKAFGKSSSAINILLSMFHGSYTDELLDGEFVARLPQLEMVRYASEDAIALSMAGRVYYCRHIMPAILTAIEAHPLKDQLLFDPAQDFGCQDLLAQSIIKHDEL